jgi:hypothetical protein
MTLIDHSPFTIHLSELDGTLSPDFSTFAHQFTWPFIVNCETINECCPIGSRLRPTVRAGTNFKQQTTNNRLCLALNFLAPKNANK